jgi:acyl carrier protein
MELEISSDATSVESLKSWLIDWMARELGLDRSSIDTSEAFLSYGLDSVQAMTMVGDIEAMLGLRLPPTLAWDYPDIDALSDHLASRMTDSSSPAPQQGPSLSASAAQGEGLLAKLDQLGDRDMDNLLDRVAPMAR